MPDPRLSEAARTTWELVQAHEADGLRAALATLDEPDRRVLAGQLGTWSRALRATARATWDASTSAQAYLRWAETVWTVACAATVGCCSTAAAAGDLLRTVSRNLDAVDSLPGQLVLDVAADRGVSWLPDLAGRLVPLLDVAENSSLWREVDLVLSAHAAPAPAQDAFVLGWLNALTAGHPEDGPAQADALEASRYLPELLPRIFDVDGLYCRPGVLEVALRSPQRHRATVLDGCLRRMIAGGTAPRLGRFLPVWKGLEPTDAEILARLPEYTAVVATAAPGIAAYAHQELTRVDDRGLLPLDDLLDLSAVTLARPQQPLVTAHLKLLQRAASRRRDRATDVVAAVEPATEHAKPAVQLLAARILADLSRQGAPDRTDVAATTSATVAAEADEQRAARAVRFDAPEQEPLPPLDLATVPGPIRTPEQLLAHVPVYLDLPSVSRPERFLDAVLEGFVHLHALDPQGLARHLADARLLAHGDRLPGRILNQLLTSLPAPDGPVPQTEGRRGPSPQEWRAVVDLVASVTAGELADARLLVHGGVPTLRIAELVLALEAGDLPSVLATPTEPTGAIAPAALLERIDAAERRGRPIAPIDLDVALLRTARTVEADLLARAARLDSPAGRRLVRWWSGAGIDELAGPVRVLLGRTLADADANPVGDPLPMDWLSQFPHDREVAVSWFAAVLPPHTDELGLKAAAVLDVRALARHVGTTGPAVHRILLTWLAADWTPWEGPPLRARAVQATVQLLGDGSLDAGAFGRSLAQDVNAKVFSLRTVLGGLEALAQAAPEATWPVLTAALPGLLGSRDTLLHRFVELTEDLARHLHRGDAIAALDTVKGRTKGAAAARSLAATLAAHRAAQETAPETSR